MTQGHQTASRGTTARASGIVLIALGFVAGMSGLDEPQSLWLGTGLGLLCAGVVAQAYGLYCGIQDRRTARSPKEDTDEP